MIAFADGTVRCWGPGGQGQIGNGRTDDQVMPQQVAQLATATSIASGTDHVCAVLDDGSLSCWGKDANNASSCLIERDHTVKCWGSNITGALPGPNGDGDSATPIVIPNLPGEP